LATVEPPGGNSNLYRVDRSTVIHQRLRRRQSHPTTDWLPGQGGTLVHQPRAWAR